MSETKDLNPTEYAPSDPTRAFKKINEVNKKGYDNPTGEQPYGEREAAEVAVADFDYSNTDWLENFRRKLGEEFVPLGEPDGG